MKETVQKYFLKPIAPLFGARGQYPLLEPSLSSLGSPGFNRWAAAEASRTGRITVPGA
jgi:hypothetical protein